MSKRPMTPEMAGVLLRQIGGGNVLAISGGRKKLIDGTLILPVGNGYSVEVDLAANDTYTVRRVFTRGIKRWVKGEATNVYNDQVGETAYQASSFRSYDFPQSA